MHRREPNDVSTPTAAIQHLIGMIFNNADPRYAGRLDYKQGGDTIDDVHFRLNSICCSWRDIFPDSCGQKLLPLHTTNPLFHGNILNI